MRDKKTVHGTTEKRGRVNTEHELGRTRERKQETFGYFDIEEDDDKTHPLDKGRHKS